MCALVGNNNRAHKLLLIILGSIMVTTSHVNHNFNYLTDSHLIHHKYPHKNYGVFFPIWDMIFGTWKGLDGNVQKLADN